MIGTIEVICGSMFSGKSEELIRRLRRVTIAEQVYSVFKPVIDDRYGRGFISSHNGEKFPAIEIESAIEIFDHINLEETDVVAIDEAQFFDKGIVKVVKVLSRSEIRVIVAGLDTDFRYEPFGSMPDLLAIANDVQKLKAICQVCKEHDADRTQRIVNGTPAFYDDPIILVGAKESYEARCRNCHKLLFREERENSSP